MGMVKNRADRYAKRSPAIIAKMAGFFLNEVVVPGLAIGTNCPITPAHAFKVLYAAFFILKVLENLNNIHSDAPDALRALSLLKERYKNARRMSTP